MSPIKGKYSLIVGLVQNKAALDVAIVYEPLYAWSRRINQTCRRVYIT